MVAQIQHLTSQVAVEPGSRSVCCDQEYSQYCRNSSGKDAPWSDKMEFVSGWYILIIVSDTLSIIGSILKIEIENKVGADPSDPPRRPRRLPFDRLLPL